MHLKTALCACNFLHYIQILFCFVFVCFMFPFHSSFFICFVVITLRIVFVCKLFSFCNNSPLFCCCINAGAHTNAISDYRFCNCYCNNNNANIKEPSCRCFYDFLYSIYTIYALIFVILMF